jgi:C-terminal processing protease CtpA/Prc
MIVSIESCTANDGTIIEGVGTSPDVVVDNDPADLRAGRDTFLKAAIANAVAPQSERARILAARK